MVAYWRYRLREKDTGRLDEALLEKFANKARIPKALEVVARVELLFGNHIAQSLGGIRNTGYHVSHAAWASTRIVLSSNKTSAV
jgi:hypothetical protein